MQAQNPELSNVLNATGSAADAAGNLSLITPTAKLVGNLSGKAATKLEEYGIKKTSEDALDMVKRKVSSLTPDEQKKLAQGGKITERGIFNDAEIKTNSFDKEIAKSVEGIVDPKKSWVDNIDRIHTKIGELATKTETLPGMLESATDTNKIREVLDGLKKESSIRFVGDTALESAYNKAIDEFMELLSHKPSTIGNVLEARKEYDILLKKKFPDAFKANADARGSIVKQAGMDVRNAANEFVEGVLPEGNEFKSLLKEQSNLYRATERIAANNLPVLDKNKFQKALELIARHPWLSAEIGGVAVGGAAIGAGGAVASAVTNPLILMALATYGTARVGKTVLTSPMIRDGLIKILTGAERGLLSATDVDGIKKIINSLSEKNYATAPVPSKPPFIDKLAGDTSGSYPTPLALPMPERGFTLQGQPTGEVLHPSKIGSNLYGVKEPSVIEGRMKIDQPLQLEGQGFTTDELWSKVSNTKLQQGSDKGLRNALKRR